MTSSMKKAALLASMMIGCLLPVLAQPSGPALYVDLCRFADTRSGDPFVQIYLAVAGQSLHFREVGDQRFQARVNISLLLQQVDGEDTLNVDSDSYILELPDDRLLPDTTLESRSQANLLNIHQLRLEPGTYLLQAQAVDSNASTPATTLAVSEFNMESLPDHSLTFSDIKWVAGRMPGRSDRRVVGRDDLIPVVTNSTFFNEDTLQLYQEIYHTDAVFGEAGRFWIRCVLYQNDHRLYAYETRPQGREVRSTPINAYKEAIYIGNLSSNTYHLQVELLNDRNVPVRIYRKRFFVYNSRRDAAFEQSVALSNPETDMFNQYTEEELDYHIQTLMYDATDQEQNFVRALETYRQKKNFLFSYLDKRKDTQEGKTVQAMWNGHLWNLAYVNQHFEGSGLEGWQTDRGRVWLTYGPPNDIERYPHESNLLPYEVWRYNRIASQNNVVFIFFDPDLATNHYPLLHSTKYGEVNNPRWRDQIYSNTQGDTPSTLDYEDAQRSTLPDTKLIIND
jgi:GWxTD domain-containing protein